MGFHALLWVLILIRRRSIAIHDGWGSSPLLQLVMRDSAWMFVGICCTYIVRRQNFLIDPVFASYVCCHSSILFSRQCSPTDHIFVSYVTYHVSSP